MGRDRRLAELGEVVHNVSDAHVHEVAQQN
jgi:hypothetical protein